jgi:hypothetical protein
MPDFARAAAAIASRRSSTHRSGSADEDLVPQLLNDLDSFVLGRVPELHAIAGRLEAASSSLVHDPRLAPVLLTANFVQIVSGLVRQIERRLGGIERTLQESEDLSRLRPDEVLGYWRYTGGGVRAALTDVETNAASGFIAIQAEPLKWPGARWLLRRALRVRQQLASVLLTQAERHLARAQDSRTAARGVRDALVRARQCVDLVRRWPDAPNLRQAQELAETIAECGGGGAAAAGGRTVGGGPPGWARDDSVDALPADGDRAAGDTPAAVWTALRAGAPQCLAVLLRRHGRAVMPEAAALYRLALGTRDPAMRERLVFTLLDGGQPPHLTPLAAKVGLPSHYDAKESTVPAPPTCSLASFFRSDRLADCTIVVGDGTTTRLPGHRIVLAAASPYFAALLVGPFAVDSSSLPELRVPPASTAVSLFVLGHCYGLDDHALPPGGVTASVEALQLADMLGLDTLAAYLEGQLLAAISRETALYLHTAGKALGRPTLAAAGARAVLEHYAAIASADEGRAVLSDLLAAA